MASIVSGFEFDIFISYRQKDNKGDRWVSEFVEALKIELESTIKDEVSLYFDSNPHGGLLETHDVDASLKEKLKCLVFIPVISRTYCDPKSFAWEHEFKSFVESSHQDRFGLKINLPNGNVASRILPVRIHDLELSDIKLCESMLGGLIRGVDFVYKSPGVNRPLRANEDHPQDNLNKTYYRDQVNKVANAIDEIISTIKIIQNSPIKETWSQKEPVNLNNTNFHFNDYSQTKTKIQLTALGRIQKKNGSKTYRSYRDLFMNFNKYIYSILFIALMVILIFVWKGHLSFPVIGKSKRELAKSYVIEAIKYFNNKDYLSAKSLVDRALASDPKYSYAWSTLAAVSVKEGDLNNAIMQTIEAVKLDPKNVTAAYNMAIALDDKKDFQQASEWYTKAIKTDSTFVPAYSALGRIKNLLNQPVDAILILSQAVEKYPESEYIYLIYRNLGNAYLLMNQPDEAIKALLHSRDLKPGESETNLYLAKAYEAAGKISLSIEIWQNYVDSETDTLKVNEAKKHLKEIAIKHLQEIIK